MNVQNQNQVLVKSNFEKAYIKTILNNKFFEQDSYYKQQKSRYFNTVKQIHQLPMPNHPKLLEIGGGQIALISQELFNYECTVADVNETYKQSILDHHIKFQCCDLLHDDLEQRNYYDLVVICEVIEHMPVPPYIVLDKVKTWLKPGGWLFLTTPNLYRLRNIVRLALGLRVFDTFRIPERGFSIGHPIEYSQTHLKWQIETAGFESVNIRLQQLDNVGSSLKTQLARIIASPLLLRPLWRDKLVVVARKPGKMEDFT
ncbi:MAG: class I SAM-dependent methyltransferase [Chroococcidiopsidaceae cyanobacterium CP_BM_RX_35]|nr:class I SAM-dependent methyltransferase [Chroococcidiopsidaceae cyanobacterium CP_BM_RX_35]